MKKLFIAAAAAAIAATPALANHVSSPNGQVLTNPEFEGGFDNRGQCQSALRQVRNDLRKSGERGEYSDLSGSEYNRASRDTTQCEQLQDGRYYVVYNAEGI